MILLRSFILGNLNFKIIQIICRKGADACKSKVLRETKNNENDE